LILPQSIRRPVSNFTGNVAPVPQVSPKVVSCPVGQGIPGLVGSCAGPRVKALCHALAKLAGPLMLEAVDVVLKPGPNLPRSFNLLLGVDPAQVSQCGLGLPL
jgi:hypothetical protein